MLLFRIVLVIHKYCFQQKWEWAHISIRKDEGPSKERDRMGPSMAAYDPAWMEPSMAAYPQDTIDRETLGIGPSLRNSR